MLGHGAADARGACGADHNHSLGGVGQVDGRAAPSSDPRDGRFPFSVAQPLAVLGQAGDKATTTVPGDPPFGGSVQ